MSAREELYAYVMRRREHSPAISERTSEMIDRFKAEVLREAHATLVARGTAAIEAADADGGRTTPSDPKYLAAATFYEAAKIVSPDKQD